MRKLLLGTVAGTVLASAFTLTSVAPASAQTPSLDALARQVQSGEVAAQYVQYRRYGYGRGYGYGPRYGYGRGYRRNGGGAAAGIIGGLAAGAIIGGAIASQQAQEVPVEVAPEDDAVAYCVQRFRSYDPQSGTYLGNDGRRRACP